MLDTPHSVRDITDRIKGLIGSDPVLADVWVGGEVLEASTSRSGHVFFTLADDDCQLRCVLFRMNALRQRSLPSPGSACVCHGRVDVYESTGSYQLYVDLVQDAGIGLAALERELLRQQLEAEGLFAPERKRPLPARPRYIGVVTSESGAVWHDIQHVLTRRVPQSTLLLAPAAVQGASSPASVIRALESLQADGRAEVIIVARGGGSASDLASFDDESLARAVFGSPIPVVSAIGHETDWTLLDLVADARAPTPSAAAELVSPDTRGEIDVLQERLFAHIRNFAALLDSRTLDVDRLRDRLERTRSTAAPARGFERVRELRLRALSIMIRDTDRRDRSLRDARSRLMQSQRRQSDRQKHEVGRLADLLEALSPTKTLGRGYAFVERADTSRPVHSIGDVRIRTNIRTHLRDGSFVAVVESVSATHSG